MAGDALMGRVFDALGNPIDNLPDPVLSDSWPLMGRNLIHYPVRQLIGRWMWECARLTVFFLLGVVSVLVLSWFRCR